jgi:hypothetical protein
MKAVRVRIQNSVRDTRFISHCPSPYLRDPPKLLNRLGIPERNYYRTADVCALLGIRPDLLRYRFYTGRYPEVEQDGKGRRFSLADLCELLRLTEPKIGNES